MKSNKSFFVGAASGVNYASILAPIQSALTFAKMVFDFLPPWLRRANATKFLGGIADVLDLFATRARLALLARFPSTAPHDAIPFLSNERGLMRYDCESNADFLQRLLKYRDFINKRGSVENVLIELGNKLNLSNSSNLFDYVDANGNRARFTIGGGFSALAPITWGADGTDRWAQFWILISLFGDNLYLPTYEASGEPARDEFGDLILTSESLGALSEKTKADLINFVKPLIAGHINRVDLVFLREGELWGIDDLGAVGTWDEDDPFPNQKWGSSAPPVILRVK